MGYKRKNWSTFVKPHIWDRVEGETRDEFSKFIKFRDLDPEERDLDEYIRKHDYDPEEIDNLIEKHDWVGRIAAWDRNFEKRLAFKIARRAKEAEEMLGRHADSGRLLLSVAARHAGKWAETDELMPVPSVVALAKTGAEIERLARDMPTNITEERTEETIDKTQLSVEDLKKLKELRAKARKKNE